MGTVKRALWCWWAHRFRYSNGQWSRFVCPSCAGHNFGQRHMDRCWDALNRDASKMHKRVM